MTATEAAKKIMELKGINQSALARMLNVKAPTLNERLRTKSMGVVVLFTMLRSMDYQLVAMPANERMKDGWFRIDDKEENNG